jgi:hypothetical protein
MEKLSKGKILKNVIEMCVACKITDVQPYAKYNIVNCFSFILFVQFYCKCKAVLTCNDTKHMQLMAV